jgi:2-oxoglutarate ferredoxin oxidoreductase subunit alpha
MSTKAVDTALKLRTPVVLLTSKEMIMTQMSFDLSKLPKIEKSKLTVFEGDHSYKSYEAMENLVPSFLPVTQNKHQVRFTASTHNKEGILQNTTPEALDNTRRLKAKLDLHQDDFLMYELDEIAGAESIILSFDITAQASREAVMQLREAGEKVDLLVAKTLFPMPEKYQQILSCYKKIIVAEENLDGQYRHLLFGSKPATHIKGVNAIGRMIQPEEIIKEVNSNG